MRRKLFITALTLLFAVSIVSAQAVTEPESFFGFKLGSDFKLAGWQKIVDYFKLIDSQSDRIQVEQLGESTEGNPFIMAIITSQENMTNLGEYRSISRRLAMARNVSENEVQNLIEKGKTVVLITCSIHATEVGAAQMSPELAYKLITEKDPRAQKILNDVVFLLVPSFNPDGLIMVKDWYDKYLETPYESSWMPWLYHLYTGHDNNRDAFMLTQVESQLVTDVLYKEWFPQVYLDMHQMGNSSARIFVPPYYDPINPNVPPLITKMNTLLGEYMATNLQEKGFEGVITKAWFTSWWEGAFLMTAWAHNTVGMLTELASCRIASPIFQRKSELEGRGKGLEGYQAQVNFPDPWDGGWWRLRDILDYDLESAFALLDFSAMYKDHFLNNMYQLASKAIKKGKQDPPFAYVIPADQRDLLAAQHMLDVLYRGGVEVHQAQSNFTADNIEYPKNSYVVLMSQPYRGYAKDMLEPQNYPDLRQYPGGPPVQPYDVAGWTLPFQLGVKAVEVIRPFDADLVELDGITFQEGNVEGGAGFGYLLDTRSTDSFAGINRALKTGLQVYRTENEISIDGATYPPGSFIVSKRGSLVRQTLSDIADDLHLQFKAVDREPENLDRLRLPKLGVYQPWFPSMHEGWSRWVLENYEFDYQSMHNEEIRAGGLKSRYDAIYIPDIRVEGILKGRPQGSVPPEFTRGIEIKGVQNIKKFVESGGVLVTMDASSEMVMENFGLPVANILENVKSKDFFCPGSILEIEVNHEHPVGYGMESTSMAYFSRSRVFKVIPSFKTKADVVAKYPKSDILKSGYLLGEGKIAKHSAVVDVPVGDGHVVMIGFDAVNRAQAQNTFKILFNAIFYGGLR